MFMKKRMVIILFCLGLVLLIYPPVASGKENVENTSGSIAHVNPPSISPQAGGDQLTEYIFTL